MSWWAFWRRRRRAAAPVGPAGPAPTAVRDTPSEESATAAPAFSGAQPEGRVTGGALPVVLPVAAPAPDRQSARAVVEQVRAVLGGDVLPAVPGAPAAQRLALAALGRRVLAAADVTAEQAARGGVPAAAARAQGETLVARSERLRRAVAPDCPPALLRLAVRVALGDEDAAGAAAEPAADLLTAAAVLLAQGVADGQETVDDLDRALTDLLTGS